MVRLGGSPDRYEFRRSEPVTEGMLMHMIRCGLVASNGVGFEDPNGEWDTMFSPGLQRILKLVLTIGKSIWLFEPTEPKQLPLMGRLQAFAQELEAEWILNFSRFL